MQDRANELNSREESYRYADAYPISSYDPSAPNLQKVQQIGMYKSKVKGLDNKIEIWGSLNSISCLRKMGRYFSSDIYNLRQQR